MEENPTVVVEMSRVFLALLTVIAGLLGYMVWLLRPNRADKKRAHAELAELRADIKALVSGDVPWVQLLLDGLNEKAQKTGEVAEEQKTTGSVVSTVVEN